MRIRVWLFGIFALLFADGAPFAATPADFLTLQTATGLPYRLFVPPGYNAANAYPLILFLHGAGERGSDNQIQLNNMANGAMHLVDNANLALQPVLMAAPQCPTGGGWDNTAMATRLSGMIDEIATAYHLDADRLYVTGLSMGGYGTWFLVTSYPTRFALAAPMSGGGDPGRAASVASLPSWFFHAVDDGTVGVDGSRSIVNALRNAGASVIYTEFATGNHGIWPQAYQNPLLFPWMIAQWRNAPSITAPPLLRITTPTANASYDTLASTVDLGGTTANSSYAVSSVGWNVIGGMSGAAAGVGPWSAVAVPLPAGSGTKTVCVTANGPSYYVPWGGGTTFNDCLRVTRNGPPPTSGTLMAAINGGGDAVTAADGTVFQADYAFEGGSTQVSTHAVANTLDDALYNNWRFGTFNYRISVPNGTYRLELYFADTYNTAVGQRSFDVLVQGATVLQAFDIIAAAGVDTALVRSFDANVMTGEILIEVRNGAIGNARLDAVRVIAGADRIFANGMEAP